MLTPTNHFGVTQGPEGRIYAIGGQDGGGGPMATVESYDIATNVWRAQTSLPAGLDGLGAAMGRNVGIYVIGGSTSSGTLTTNEVGLIRP